MEKKMKSTKTVGAAGFTLLEITIVTAIISLLATLAIPNFIRARASSQATSCINNLRQIDSAAQQFAMEQHKRNGQQLDYPTDLTPYVRLNSDGSIPPCPAGGNYTCDVIGTPPTCDLSDTTTPAHILQ